MIAVRWFLLAILATTSLACSLVPAHAPHALAADRRYIESLQVDPLHPQTVFIEGQFGCTDPSCYQWAERSLDGGATWTDITSAVDSTAPKGQTDVDFDPFLLDGDGKTLASTLYIQPDGSPGGQSNYLVVSHDRGSTWSAAGPTGGFEGGNQYGYSLPATEPRAPGWIYAQFVEGDYLSSTATIAVRSRDGGRTWTEGGDIAAFGVMGNLVIDPRAPTTVYGNCADHTCVIRSLDAGNTWSAVPSPSVHPALTSFTVSFDPHEPGLLVGRSSDPGVPADRIYLSANHGETWRVARCPGDLRGVCPIATVDNVFGSGRAYGFFKDGIHPFVGAGAAGSRLAISDHLPVSSGHILAVGSGANPAAPVYLMVSGRHGKFDGLLYRSVDAGRSWRLLNPPA